MSTMTVHQALEMAVSQHRAGNLAQAEAIYRRVLAGFPDHAGALHLLGVLLHQSGDNVQAEELIRKAIARSPGEAPFHANLSRVLMQTGRKDQAILAQREALRLEPTVANWYALGIALQESGVLEEAASSFQQALRLEPAHVESINALGVLEQLAGRLDQAAALFRKALEIAPAYAEALANLGEYHHKRGELEAAVLLYRKALALKPAHPGFLRALGDVLLKQRHMEEAVRLYRQSLSLRPRDVDTCNNLAGALRALDRTDESIAMYQQALAIDPAYAHARGNLGTMHDLQGYHALAIADAREAVRLAPADVRLHSNLLYLLHFDPATAPLALQEEHLRWNQRHAHPLVPPRPVFAQQRDRDKRLRIAYISPNFYNHSVGRFMLPIIEGHLRRNTADIFCLSDLRVTVPDWATARFQQLLAASSGWHSIYSQTDEQVARLVQDLQVDIFVDLAMHMDGSRLLVFARRPAPVQVTYLAYCSTTGVETMDYRLTDPWLDPDPGFAAQIYAEKSAFLESYWCYAAGPDISELNDPPLFSTGTITFGCLNSFTKVSEPALAVWAELLQQVPGSRLVLHALPGSHCDRVRSFLAQRGISADRIEFVPRLAPRDYFRQYHRIDIALDPFPYAGGTTTCDALYMGVPVVTLRPPPEALAVGRGGMSILHNAGIPEWIANTPAEYVAIARRLAQDAATLTQNRRTLRARLEASVLMDVPRFAAKLETTYRAMWETWCAGEGQPP